jgi:hypothetical protein
MKKFVYLLCVGMILVSCGDGDTDATKPATSEAPVDQVAELRTALQAASPLGSISDDQSARIATLFKKLLPEISGYDWVIDILLSEDDEEVLISLELNQAGGDDQAMWFHVIYVPKRQEEEKADYGLEEDSFDGYKGMGMENEHLFIMVGNTEIRAVAEADEYKNDAKIREALRGFKLKLIETL